MQFEAIKSLIEAQLPGAVQGELTESSPPGFQINKNLLHQVCDLLLSNDQTYFDSLSCLTGIDNGEEEGTMEVVYHLYSIPYDLHLTLSVEVDRKEPSVDSVTDIWGGANWHEREAFDLLGIQFNHHPDLRRILLPDDWEGFPLRKDYSEQETYHDIKVKY